MDNIKIWNKRAVWFRVSAVSPSRFDAARIVVITNLKRSVKEVLASHPLPSLQIA